jgi:import inner membrane translocase subunit TIM22
MADSSSSSSSINNIGNNNGQPPLELSNRLHYGVDWRPLPLPFFRQVFPPKVSDEVPFLPTLVQESCGFKIITGGMMGAVMGVGLGLFMGAMGDVSPIQVVQGREVPQAPVREQLRAAYKATANKSVGWAKNFGVLTALFGGVDCLIEKYRGKHDVWNPVISGCVVGGTMSAKGGPAAACLGCAGFAGFSFVVDKIMGTH